MLSGLFTPARQGCAALGLGPERFRAMLSSRAKHRVFASGFRAIQALGADRWLSPAARGLGVILTFHHVSPDPVPAFAPNRLLGITPDFLDLTLRELDARGFEIIGLDAVPERLAEPDYGPPFAVLTFAPDKCTQHSTVTILQRARVRIGVAPVFHVSSDSPLLRYRCGSPRIVDLSYTVEIAKDEESLAVRDKRDVMRKGTR